MEKKIGTESEYEWTGREGWPMYSRANCAGTVSIFLNKDKREFSYSWGLVSVLFSRTKGKELKRHLIIFVLCIH